MAILKLKIFQETACYKKPLAFKVAETYPLPPYSTVIGMFHKIIGAKPGEYFPMNISIQGNYESIFNNYQTFFLHSYNLIFFNSAIFLISYIKLETDFFVHLILFFYIL